MKNKILTPFKYFTMLVMALSLTFLTNCSDDDDVDNPLDVVETEYENIMETLEDLGGYDTLIYLLESYPIDENGTLLSSLFSDEGSFTLFAPDNDAFAALYATVGVSKASDVSPAIIVSLLTFHGAGYIVTEITPGGSIETVQGEAIIVNLNNPDADGSEGSPEDGTLLTGSNTKGILVADEPVIASNGVIWDVGTVLIPPSTGGLLASILGTNAASLLISDMFSEMGDALQASEVFAVVNELPSLIDFLSDPEVMSTVFAVPNQVFEAAGLSADAFDGEDWYGILSHHVVNATAALEATDNVSPTLDALWLTGGIFDDGVFVNGMFEVPDEEGGMTPLPLYIKYKAELAGQFGGATGVLIDANFDALLGMSEDSAGFWDAEVLIPDAQVNVNGVIHVIAGFLSPMGLDDEDDEDEGNPMEGTWHIAPIPGALAVGPNLGDLGWWSNSAGDIETRGCLFDDEYIFDEGEMSINEDGDEIWTGEYTIITDGSTWIEPWQGVDEEQCGDPVAPHDESNAPFTYEVNADEETVTLFGVGAYFGLAKVTNEGQLGAELDASDVPESITYTYVGDEVDEEDHHATFMVDYSPDGDGVWVFVLENDEWLDEDYDDEGIDLPGDGHGGWDDENGPMVGAWQIAPIPAALAVGPNENDLGWWSNSAGDVDTRGCLFDDTYIFNPGEMSINEDGEEIWTGMYEILHDGATWLEPWQGVDEEQCGDPVAPHDVSNAPFSYEINVDAQTVTLNGTGAYFGLAKVTNNGQLGAEVDAANVPESVTYTYIGDDAEEADGLATFMVDYSPDGDGVWVFVLEYQGLQTGGGPGDGTGGGPGDGTGGGNGG
tara:strand:- start:188 stop:2692 length:2505 start_codon:yes stop_codon:yes gene_type:complete